MFLAIQSWKWFFSVTCPSGFTYLHSAGSCYKAVFEGHNWTSAAQKCQELRPGSHLAAITTAAKDNAIKTFLKTELSSTYECEPACSICSLLKMHFEFNNYRQTINRLVRILTWLGQHTLIIILLQIDDSCIGMQKPRICLLRVFLVECHYFKYKYNYYSI